MQKDIHYILRNVGYFTVWDGRGEEVNRYTIDDIEYVQVTFKNTDQVYTYLVGD